MSKRLLALVLTLSAVSTLPTLKAQSLCPAGVVSDKLICLVPQAFGPNGLELPNTGSPQLSIVPHFQNILPDSLKPLNSAISKQVALLPLASPSSGIIFTQDPVSK